MRQRGWIALGALLLTLLACGFALGEEAREITSACELKANGNGKHYEKMTDQDYTTWYNMKEKKGYVEITAPEGEEIGGLYVQLYDRLLPYEVQVLRGDEWETIHEWNSHLTDWYTIPAGYTKLRVYTTSKQVLRIAELRVFTAGDRPAWAHQWMDLQKADIMQLVAHPDDELLWFGGFLPTYAGERGWKVQVVYLVPTGGQRRLELLDGLWTCGVRYYPAFLNFRDNRGQGLKGQYQRWGEGTVLSRVTGAIRQYKPEMLITQAVNGEYGHGAHRVAADACLRCYDFAANAKKYPKSAEAYGTWQVKKLYVHEYEKNQLTLDWHVPLDAFGGKDAYAVAVEALACHRSQINRGWEMEDHGKHDNAIFGLARTEVGPDTGTDLMEHIGETSD